MMDKRERRARTLLRHIAKGARLVGEPHGAYVLVGGRRRRPVDPSAVQLARGKGWLGECDGALVLEQAGLALLVQDKTAREDRFAAQHRVLETKLVKDERGRESYVVVNAAESPLALLRLRNLIDDRAFEAGEKLRRDFTLAQVMPRLGVDYEAPVGRRKGKPETLISETALAAKQRFNRAMRALGPGLSDVMFDVCCMLEGLEESEQRRNWPRGSGRIVLRLALERLAAHYGRRACNTGRMRSWRKQEG